MKTGKSGRDLIMKWEGCKLESYKCSAGVWTIGYGNTFYKNGSKVKPGDKLKIHEAVDLFNDLLPKFERIVERKITIDLHQNQFDALVSHTYNTGGSNTLFRLINSKSSVESIESWWRNKYITANGTRLKGLINRRNEEFQLFIKK